MLSLVIPTLNRKTLLGDTLSHLMPQVGRAKVPVEVVVSDNCSDAPLDDLVAAYPGVRLVRWPERVNIEGSFERSVGLATYSFVCLFGDDDIVLPGYLDEVLKCLDRRDMDLGLIYANRLIGNDTLELTQEIAHPAFPYGISYMEPREFIEEFNHHPGFVTSVVFSKAVWEAGIAGYLPEFNGYSFLSRIYSGMSGTKVAFIRPPILIQRRGVQAWKAEWPDYWLLSMPRLLHRLDRLGVTGCALARWQNEALTLKGFTKDCIVAKALKHSWRSDFWRESRSYHSDVRRKLVSWFIQYLVPSRAARAVFFMGSKKYRKARS
jgi:glycosyltransferase involved in cell wall biosynthesis